MRLIGLIGLVAGALATSVLADAPTPTPANDSQKPALSIWSFGDGGDARHLQSGLECPATFRGYRRDDLHFYDRFGLDVSCDYVGRYATLTVYATRRSGTSVDDAMAEAKREYLQLRANLHPQHISDTSPSDGPLTWQVALYDDDVGRDGIWIADLSGWTLEFRSTYRASSEADTLADIAAMTQIVLRSAGAHLDLCAKTSPPLRNGAPIRDAKADKDSAMMGAILGGAILAAGTNGGKALPDAPVTWCAEQPLRLENTDVLFWRAVHDDGSDAVSDRVTGMTFGNPPTLVVGNDAMTNLVEGQSGGSPKWSATMADAEHTRIYGYFTGRPPPEALSALFADIVNGKAKPLIGFGVKGKSISIEMPSEK